MYMLVWTALVFRCKCVNKLLLVYLANHLSKLMSTTHARKDFLFLEDSTKMFIEKVGKKEEGEYV